MIPRRLHRVWLYPPGPPMPAEFVRYGAAWRRLHPSWAVTDWQDTVALRPLLNAALFAAPPAGEVHRCRADVVRLEALWRQGGVYVDTDVEPVRALDPLLEHVAAAGASAFICWSSNRWQGRRLVSNAVIGAEPGHPWIRRAIAGLPVSVAAHPGAFLALQTVHYLTDLLGPLNAQGVTADGLLVLPEATFYPVSIADRRRGRRPPLGPGTYGVHHWANSRKREAVA